MRTRAANDDSSERLFARFRKLRTIRMECNVFASEPPVRGAMPPGEATLRSSLMSGAVKFSYWWVETVVMQLSLLLVEQGIVVATLFLNTPCVGTAVARTSVRSDPSCQ